jgi:hypothetical protein
MGKKKKPPKFQNRTDAIRWALSLGSYRDGHQALLDYEAIKRRLPSTYHYNGAVWAIWMQVVQERQVKQLTMFLAKGRKTS